MKIVINSILPFNGFVAMTVWPFIFVRKEYVQKMNECGQWEVMLNHESIHGRQQVEMLLILFYIWYGIEFLIRKFGGGNAYRNISFEREAYANEKNMEYLKNRKFWAFTKYLKQK